MRNIVQCDKCGLIKKLEERGGRLVLPKGWELTDVGDLCKKCNNKYINYLMRFEI